MSSEVMEAVLARFNNKLDNAMCHPESMIGQFLQIKIIFFPKNTTSRLQPLDAGIIRNFRVKYRKRVVKCLLARIQKQQQHRLSRATAQTVEGGDVLVAIRWLHEVWKEVTNLTIKNCFEKCGIKRDNELIKVEEDDDLEFEALVKDHYGYVCCRIRQFRQKSSSV